MMSAGPGKFEGEGFETFVLYRWTLDGWESYASDGERTIATLFVGPFGNQVDQTTIEEGKAEGWTDEEIADAVARLTTAAGAILYHYESGFEASTLYDTKAGLDKEWTEIMDSLPDDEEGTV